MAVDVSSEAVAGVTPRTARFDLETIFQAQYERIARVIARIIHDPARAEELAVEVFLKWSRTPAAHENRDGKAEGWLYRAAVRKGLDELRKQARRSRYERLAGFLRSPATPEDVRAAKEEQNRVRAVLAAIEPRHAELLLLRSHGLSYGELASSLELNPASVGTFLSRAQQAFRKEYLRRYGNQ
jgi:RNA polymerase sigma-70 factor (ECF subfamily)